MGIRIEYREVPKMDLEKSITQDFIQFKEWYNAIGNKYPEDISYNMLELIENLNPKNIFEQINNENIDEFIALYIADYCGYGPGKLKTIKNSTFLNIRNYINDQDIIEKTCSSEVKQLWNFILNGRSIINEKPFKISDSVFKFCIFSERECQLLKSEFSFKFKLEKSEEFNKYQGIGSLLDAINKKKGNGLLITVA